MKRCFFVYDSTVDWNMQTNNETLRIVNQTDVINVKTYIDFDDEFE